MNYIDLMIAKQEYEERVRWLGSIYSSANGRHHPNRAARILNRWRNPVGRMLVSFGERLQQPQQDMSTPAPMSR